MKRAVKILFFALSLCLFIALFAAAAFAESKPYAVYNSADSSLTFCVGEKTADGIVRGTGLDPVSGDTYYTGFVDTTNISSASAVKWYAKRAQITSVVFLDEIAPKNTAFWFNGFSSLTSITGINNLKTGSVTQMNQMFGGCSALQQLDLSSFDTGLVENMYYMFTGCSALQQLNLSGFNNGSVVDMHNMFYNCRALQQLDLSNFKTGSVTNMSSMFNGCSALQQLNLSSFNTGSVTNMSSMFYNCSALQQLILSSFNTGSVTNMNQMFYGCSVLQQLNLSSFDTGLVETMQSMFNGCSTLKQLNLSGFNTGSVTNMSSMFNGCSALQQLNLSGFNTGSVTNMSNMFNGCSALSSLTLGANFSFVGGTNAKLPAVTNTAPYTGKWVMNGNADSPEYSSSELMTSYDGTTMSGTWIWGKYPAAVYAVYKETSDGGTLTFCFGERTADGIVRGTGLDPVPGDTYYTGFVDTTDISGASAVKWYAKRAQITSVVFLDEITPKNTAYWFDGCSNLTSITGIDKLNTEDSVDMRYMFYGCTALQQLDLSGFDTGSVTDMCYMFNSCSALQQLDLSSFDTGRVENMSYMFHNCYALQQLDMSVSFTTGSVKDMSFMFGSCYVLEQLNLRSFNTGMVTNMSNMFNRCYALKSLDLSSFVTGSVTNMGSMFNGCSVLEQLNISNFDTGSVTAMGNMFSLCPKLSSLTLGADFSFVSGTNAYLPDITSTSVYTGKWVMEGNPESPKYTSRGLMTNYDGTTMAGTWVWEKTPIKAYAVYKETAEGGTLTFCVGEKTTDGIVRGTGLDPVSGDTYYSDFDEITTVSESYEIKWYYKRSQITSVVFLDEIAPKNTAYWFNECANLSSVSGIDKLNTGNVTDMHHMFNRCSSLRQLDLSSFNTGSVTSMSGMFYGCSSLQQLDLSGFNNGIVTDMSNMFNGCSALKQLNLSGFHTGNAMNLNNMFFGCSALQQLDLSSFTTGRVTNMYGMFGGCSVLQQLDLSNFTTGSVTNMGLMFGACSSLQQLDLSSFNTGSVTSMTNMFGNCSALQQLNLSSFNTENVTNMGGMFNGCSALSSLILGENFSFVSGTNTSLPNITETFEYTGKWVMEGVSDSPQYSSSNLMTSYNGATMAGRWVWEKSPIAVYAVYKETADGGTLTFCVGERTTDGIVRGTGLEPVSGDTYYTDFVDTTDISSASAVKWYAKRAQITSVVFLDEIAPKNTAYWFDGCSNLTSITGIDKLNTEDSVDMRYMFYGCTALQQLDLSGFDTGSVTDMCYMFNSCSALQQLDLSSFDTGSVEDMSYMFHNCYALEQLDLSVSFTTGRVKNMSFMFGSCYVLEQLNLRSFNTGMVKNMSNMFNRCYALKSLDLSSFVTGSVTNMGSMFNGCSALEQLNISNFDTGSVTAMSNMFTLCSKLSSLTLGADFSFVSGTNADLPDITSTSVYTGKWVMEGNPESPKYTSRGLMTNYDGTTMAGTWVWERYFTDLADAEISPIEPQIYTRNPIEPALSVTMNGRELEAGTDYTVSYENNIEIGNAASATAHGIGAYEGEKTVYFTIYCAHGTLNEAVKENEVLPTCTLGGSYDLVVTCALCGAEMSREAVAVDPLGHDVVEHEGKAPTCTESGWAAYETCSRCEYTTYKALAKLGHDFGEWRVVRAASEDGPGLMERVCSRCGEKQEKEIPYKISIWQKIVELIKMLLAKFRSIC